MLSGSHDMKGRRLSVVVGLLLGMLACNARPIPPDDGVPAEVRAYARARCLTLEECGCESDTYRDRAECEQDIVDIYLEHIDGDETLDLGCFESAARSWGKDLCGDPIFDPPCNVIEPTRQLGDWCSGLDLYRGPFARVPMCVAGLVCVDNTCIEAIDARQDGEPCSPDGWCGTTDLVCFEGRCEPPHLEGEPCESPATCAFGPTADLYCTAGICVPQKDNGESCQDSGECLSLLCVGGQCDRANALVCLSAEI